MIVKMNTNLEQGYTTIQLPPAGNDLFRHSSAIWDQDRKAWLITAQDTPAITRWLRDKGHTVVTDQQPKTNQQPTLWRDLQLPARQPEDVAHRGADLARAALHAAKAHPD